MKYLKELLLTVVLVLVFSQSAFAGFIRDVEPQGIFVSGDVVIFGTSGNLPAGTCNYFNRYFRISLDSEGGSARYAMLLASELSGRKIAVWYSDSTTPGQIVGAGCVQATLAKVVNLGVVD